MQTHYDVLGVDPTADRATIKRAWHVRMLLLHPDRHQGTSEEVLDAAARETRLVNQAWEVLKDPATRRAYDEQLAPRAPWLSANGNHSSANSEPAPAERKVEVSCQRCRTLLRVASDAKAYRCPNCKVTWRQKSCTCGGVVSVDQKAVRWTCPSCGIADEAWPAHKRIRVPCVKCEATTEIMAGTQQFACSGCQREYLRCACGKYQFNVFVLTTRWQCLACQRKNVRPRTRARAPRLT